MRPRVYLASGWFNPEQKKQMDEVYEVLSKYEEMGLIDLFAPFYDGIVLTKDDPNLKKKMETVWWLDVAMVSRSQLVVVCTQDHDVGTVYEAGFAGAHNIPVICYNSKPELGLNVMLAQAARGFAKTQEELKRVVESFLKAYVEETTEEWRFNRWEGVPI
jgi:nucleoside 2-deoxyribosyltransferase